MKPALIVLGVVLVAVAGVLLAARGGAFKWTLEEVREAYSRDASVFEEVQGLSIHLHDQGPRDAPAVVAIHGSWGSLRNWDRLVEEIGDRYRIIRLDLPGYGLSDTMGLNEDLPEGWDLAELVRELLDRRDIDRVHLVGTSSGGSVAHWFAARYPERVGKLVMMNNPSQPVRIPREARPWSYRWRMTVYDDWLRWRSRDYWWAYYRYLWGEPERLPASLIAEYQDLNRRIILDWPRILIPANPPQPEIDRRLGSVTAPTLVIWGMRDPVLPPEMLDSLTSRLTATDPTVIRMETVGHYPMSEVPEATAKLVADFLDDRPVIAPEGL